MGRQSDYLEQGISIGRSCIGFATAVHELGHALGFWHEQSRPDRNDYITVLKDNIASAFVSNFDRLTEQKINSLGVGYDYNSIMHYNADTFGRNGRTTIVANDPSIPVGEAVELSELDILQTNLLYECGKSNSAHLRMGSYLFDWFAIDNYSCSVVLYFICPDHILRCTAWLDFLSLSHYSPVLSHPTSSLSFLHPSSLSPSFPSFPPPSHILILTLNFTYSPFCPTDTQNFPPLMTTVPPQPVADVPPLPECGEEFTNQYSGTFHSPGFPSYSHNQDCVWRITEPEGMLLTIRLNTFFLEWA